MVLTEEQAFEIAFSRLPGLKGKQYYFTAISKDQDLINPKRKFRFKYDYELCFYLGGINMKGNQMKYTFKFSDVRSVMDFDGLEVNITKEVDAFLQQYSTGSNV